MTTDIQNFGTFIKDCFKIFQIEIFDWGFTFAQLFLTSMVIMAILKLILIIIGKEKGE